MVRDRVSAAREDYALLGLTPEATPEDVKAAWRRTARATHPDLHPNDPDADRRFKAAQAAYERLTDPTRGPAPRARHAGPDDDWFDTCAWIAEAHLLALRGDALPRYATRHTGGPSLVAALTDAVERGALADRAPAGPPSRFGRLWMRYVWRRFDMVVDDGPPGSMSPVGLLRRGDRILLVVWPRVFWAEGVREDEPLRAAVRRSVDLAVAAAAPALLGVALPIRPDTDRAWWVGRLFWPVVWLLVGLLSLVLLGASWSAARAAG